MDILRSKYEYFPILPFSSWLSGKKFRCNPEKKVCFFMSGFLREKNFYNLL